MKTRILIGSVAAAVAVTTITACGGDKANEPWNDAPRNGNDNGPAMIIAMPDGFNNAATKCIAGTGIRIAVLYHDNSNYGSVALVADPTCH